MAGLSLSGLCKSFDGNRVVDGIDLEFGDGQLTALLGPSGCGKTTTLRMIAGLERPNAGTIRIAGTVVSDGQVFVPPERRNVGMVFQSYAIWPHLTVFENVAFPLRLRGRRGAALDGDVRAALRMVRLDALAERYPAQLSGGQQQRVSLARATAYRPDTLLLDEPLSNLDANLREEMRTEIRALQRKLGISAVYVTHDQAEAMAISDRVVVLDKGRIAQAGAPREIYAEPATAFVAAFVGWSNVFPAVVRDSAGVLGLGRELRCQVPAGCAADRPAFAAIRARDVRPAAMGETDNVISGPVASVTFVGDHLVCAIECDGRLVQGHVPIGADVAEGRELRLRLDPAGLRVLAS